MVSYKKAIDLIRAKEIQFVDLKFCDIRGVWQHLTVSGKVFIEAEKQGGIGFDGSSIRGLQSINESDMLLVPDTETCFIDPFFEKTLSCICSMYDPLQKKPSPKDPRHTAKKAEQYLKDTKMGTLSYWGPEIEFFLFEKATVEFSPYHQSVVLQSRELPESSKGAMYENDGYALITKGGYFPASPFDKLQDYRSEVVKILEDLGVEVEMHHHEVAAAGQVEIDMKYDTLVRMADKVMMYKYVARNVAQRMGLTAIFLPKPVYGDNGSGMHVHQSIFNKDKNVFYDSKGYGELSKKGYAYIAGLLTHIKSLLAFSNPTTNSYRRLVPHFEAPTTIAFSARNRSAAVRIPLYFSKSEKSKRLEFRCPDPACNPYLAFSSQLIAGVDGMKRSYDPAKLGFGPFEENIWERSDIPQTPKSLFDTLSALESDEVYAKSGVFSKELVKSYIDLKKQEAISAEMHPSVADFYYYGDL